MVMNRRRERRIEAWASRGMILGLAGAIWLALAPAKLRAQDASWAYGTSTITASSGASVGVGTTSPAAVLEVDSAANPVANLVGTTSGNQWVTVGNSASHMNLGIGTSGAGYVWTADGNFFIGNNSSPTLYVLGMNKGSVGIGTTSPQHTLSVVGTIDASEVIVSSTGQDYVFDPGYKLAPLSEVSKYIEENHHLPDIPSAAEVQKNGVGLSEMQGKMLAKIEELTLHMIQAEERNNRLEERNRELQDRVARLEAATAKQ
jgi:hypothetical protein